MAAITITIGSDTVCAHAPKGRPRLSIQETLNGRATAQVTIMDPDHADWLASMPGGFKLQEITILDGATKLFAGIVTNQRNYTEKQIAHGYIDLRATDFAIRLDSRRIFRVWEAGEFINTIVGDILDFEPPSGDTLDEEGFTKAATSAVPIIAQRYIADGLTASEVLNDLAKLTGYIWYVDWDKDIHFELPGANAAPFDLDENGCVFRDLSTEQSTDNLRNIEWSRQQFAALPALTQVFAGNGTDRGFLVDFPVGEAPIVLVRDATYAQATVTFIGIPSAGDTVTIDGDAYTFRTALTGARDVLIGSTFAECARNLSFAINNVLNWAGIYFDSATAAHPTCEAAYAGGVVVTVRFRTSGSGNGTTLAESSAAINISSSTLTGATAGTSTPKSVGIFGEPDGTADWYWSPASLAITQDNGATVLATGEFLEVQYHPLFSNSFPVQDAALVAADGVWESLSEAEGARTGAALYANAQATIRQYGLTNVTIIEAVVDSVNEPLVNTLRSGMTQDVVLDNSHNFNGGALITGVSRSYFYGDEDWQTENRIAAIAYPGSAGNEPWQRWSDLFVPSSGGLSMGGGGTIVSGGGGSTAIEAPGPITNFGTPAVDYTDPLRAVVTNTADLPTAVNGFDGCNVYLMVDFGLGSETGPYPCGHVPHEVGAAGPFNFLIDIARPTTGEDWTFLFCSRNPSKTASLVLTAGPDQSPNFTVSITARPSSTAPPAAPNVDSVTATVGYDDPTEPRKWRITGAVDFPASTYTDIDSFTLRLNGKIVSTVPERSQPFDLNVSVPSGGANYNYKTGWFDLPDAAEDYNVDCVTYNSDGVATDSPTTSSTVTVASGAPVAPTACSVSIISREATYSLQVVITPAGSLGGTVGYEREAKFWNDAALTNADSDWIPLGFVDAAATTSQTEFWSKPSANQWVKVRTRGTTWTGEVTAWVTSASAAALTPVATPATPAGNTSTVVTKSDSGEKFGFHIVITANASPGTADWYEAQVRYFTNSGATTPDSEWIPLGGTSPSQLTIDTDFWDKPELTRYAKTRIAAKNINGDLSSWVESSILTISPFSFADYTSISLTPDYTTVDNGSVRITGTATPPVNTVCDGAQVYVSRDGGTVYIDVGHQPKPVGSTSIQSLDFTVDLPAVSTVLKIKLVPTNASGKQPSVDTVTTVTSVTVDPNNQALKNFEGSVQVPLGSTPTISRTPASPGKSLVVVVVQNGTGGDTPAWNSSHFITPIPAPWQKPSSISVFSFISVDISTLGLGSGNKWLLQYPFMNSTNL